MTGWYVNERALEEAFKDSFKVLFQRLFVDTEWHHPQRIGWLGSCSEIVASRMFLAWRRVPNLLRPLMNVDAGPNSRAVSGVSLRPLACCDRGFESHPEHGCLSVVITVCCQVEVSATD